MACSKAEDLINQLIEATLKLLDFGLNIMDALRVQKLLTIRNQKIGLISDDACLPECSLRFSLNFDLMMFNKLLRSACLRARATLNELRVCRLRYPNAPLGLEPKTKVKFLKLQRKIQEFDEAVRSDKMIARRDLRDFREIAIIFSQLEHDLKLLICSLECASTMKDTVLFAAPITDVMTVLSIVLSRLERLAQKAEIDEKIAAAEQQKQLQEQKAKTNLGPGEGSGGQAAVAQSNSAEPYWNRNQHHYRFHRNKPQRARSNKMRNYYEKLDEFNSEMFDKPKNQQKINRNSVISRKHESVSAMIVAASQRLISQQSPTKKSSEFGRKQQELQQQHETVETTIQNTEGDKNKTFPTVTATSTHCSRSEMLLNYESAKTIKKKTTKPSKKYRSSTAMTIPAEVEYSKSLSTHYYHPNSHKLLPKNVGRFCYAMQSSQSLHPREKNEKKTTEDVQQQFPVLNNDSYELNDEKLKTEKNEFIRKWAEDVRNTYGYKQIINSTPNYQDKISDDDVVRITSHLEHTRLENDRMRLETKNEDEKGKYRHYHRKLSKKNKYHSSVSLSTSLNISNSSLSEHGYPRKTRRIYFSKRKPPAFSNASSNANENSKTRRRSFNYHHHHQKLKKKEGSCPSSENNEFGTYTVNNINKEDENEHLSKTRQTNLSSKDSNIQCKVS
ncbi:unnamed protein product [Didymodactylos carnosus]|uniref:Uncharacterized protein n=1 Tax=Didymodactylos carnosus TaxID=1234261 RepID=A0A814HM63_9BILA|nr:unnamed protein product [Didymodactylos carnosus]CAF3782684.1 unnamed protein product [Didymodactylos carnosus]